MIPPSPALGGERHYVVRSLVRPSVNTCYWAFGHCFFEPPFGGLRAAYDDHLWLVGKRVVDFLLVFIELFTLGVTAEALYERISTENRRFRSNAVSLTQNFS